MQAEDPRVLVPADRPRWESALQPGLQDHLSFDRLVKPGEMAPEPGAGLPEDRELLFSEIWTLSGSDGGKAFEFVGDALREAKVSRETGAALFSAAATIPGVEILGAVQDTLGRPGLGLGYVTTKNGAPLRKGLIFDESKSSLLGERTVLLAPASWTSAPPGTTVGYRSYTAAGMLDSTDARATAG